MLVIDLVPSGTIDTDHRRFTQLQNAITSGQRHGVPGWLTRTGITVRYGYTRDENQHMHVVFKRPPKLMDLDVCAIDKLWWDSTSHTAYIDLDAWNSKSSNRSRERRWLIGHAIGHALGHQHDDPDTPVMHVDRPWTQREWRIRPKITMTTTISESVLDTLVETWTPLNQGDHWYAICKQATLRHKIIDHARREWQRHQKTSIAAVDDAGLCMAFTLLVLSQCPLRIGREDAETVGWSQSEPQKDLVIDNETIEISVFSKNNRIDSCRFHDPIATQMARAGAIPIRNTAKIRAKQKEVLGIDDCQPRRWRNWYASVEFVRAMMNRRSVPNAMSLVTRALGHADPEHARRYYTAPFLEKTRMLYRAWGVQNAGVSAVTWITAESVLQRVLLYGVRFQIDSGARDITRETTQTGGNRQGSPLIVLSSAAQNPVTLPPLITA